MSQPSSRSRIPQKSRLPPIHVLGKHTPVDEDEPPDIPDPFQVSIAERNEFLMDNIVISIISTTSKKKNCESLDLI